jgi:hypothetical protein
MQATVFALLVVNRKHPPVYDETAIGKSRVQLGFLALIVFGLCLPVVPLSQ